MSGPPKVDFELDTFQLVLLRRGERASEIDQETADRLAAEHIAHNLMLKADGLLLAAGAVVGAESLVGLGFWRLPQEEVLRLKDSDPGIRAGLYQAELVRFMCPKGAITFEEQ